MEIDEHLKYTFLQFDPCPRAGEPMVSRSKLGLIGLTDLFSDNQQEHPITSSKSLFTGPHFVYTNMLQSKQCSGCVLTKHHRNSLRVRDGGVVQGMSKGMQIQMLSATHLYRRLALDSDMNAKTIDMIRIFGNRIYLGSRAHVS